MPTTLALYPLQGKAIDPKPVDFAIRRQLEGLPRYLLLGPGDTAAVLAPPGGGLGLNCDDGNLECLASAGRLAGAVEVLFGVVTPDRLELRLIDVKTQGEVRRVEVRGFPIDAAREAVVALLQPEKYLGAIEVRGEHGRLSVDGVDRADLPLAAPLALPVGQHLLTVMIPGQPSFGTGVDVLFDRTTTIDTSGAAGSAATAVMSAPAPVIPLASPAPVAREGLSTGRTLAYAGFTAAILGGAAGIVCGAIAADNSQALGGASRPIPYAQAATAAQQASRARDFGVAADVVWATSAAVGIASVVLYVLSPSHPPELTAGLALQGSGALVRF